jgi:uncharacterized lipoprotein YehR (DUF1307 family)
MGLGNAVWKQFSTHKKITKSEAEKVLDALAEAFKRLKSQKRGCSGNFKDSH